MSNTNKHTEFDRLTKGFFGNSEIPFPKTKEDIWSEIESKLVEKPGATKSRTFLWRASFAAAAAVAILVATFSIFRFYTTTVDCPPGQHLTATLPDGSSVQLNAESSLSYKPFWWRFSRDVQFEGEGFFEVEKGKKFTVTSTMAKTIVLGTSFNVYARNSQYQVTCHTGKVKVVSKKNNEGILSPGYEAKLSLDGKVVIYKSADSESSISWIDNKFIFTAIPLSRVFDEIERQYNVNIDSPAEIDYLYTGYFTKNKSIEEVLDLVCKPFGLTFVAKSSSTFVVRN